MPLTYHEEVRLMKLYNQKHAEDYATTINHLTKRLGESEKRKQLLREKLNDIKETWDRYKRECHDCQKYNAEYRTIGCQASIEIAETSTRSKVPLGAALEFTRQPKKDETKRPEATKSKKIELIELSDSD